MNSNGAATNKERQASCKPVSRTVLPTRRSILFPSRHTSPPLETPSIKSSVARMSSGVTRPSLNHPPRVVRKTLVNVCCRAESCKIRQIGNAIICNALNQAPRIGRARVVKNNRLPIRVSLGKQTFECPVQHCWAIAGRDPHLESYGLEAQQFNPTGRKAFGRECSTRADAGRNLGAKNPAESTIALIRIAGPTLSNNSKPACTRQRFAPPESPTRDKQSNKIAGWTKP